MLQGQLDKLDLIQPIAPKLAQILRELSTQLVADAPLGRCDVRGEQLFYTVSLDTTEPQTHRRCEFHQSYLDIQVVLDGEERYGYATVPLVDIDEDKLQASDVAFGQPVNERFVTLSSGDFIVFAPYCPHRPLVAVDAPQKVKKAVIKVHRSLLD
ncbi:YhcH/YjgK/YiaL family protein [Celerinatantimonas yamalensis]|uniref:YhcH/YjgK/YiaL family protein n=1 Tax=Celerinatantimonas yamalensis TaxID=559956 RepID=A0ABW9G9U7_9GAMM